MPQCLYLSTGAHNICLYTHYGRGGVPRFETPPTPHPIPCILPKVYSQKSQWKMDEHLSSKTSALWLPLRPLLLTRCLVQTPSPVKIAATLKEWGSVPCTNLYWLPPCWLECTRTITFSMFIHDCDSYTQYRHTPKLRKLHKFLWRPSTNLVQTTKMTHWQLEQQPAAIGEERERKAAAVTMIWGSVLLVLLPYCIAQQGNFILNWVVRLEDSSRFFVGKSQLAS